MGKVPVLKPREVVALIEARGFVEVRQRGSHKQFRHSDGRCTTVPFHAGRDISPIMLHQIAKDIGLTIEELLKDTRNSQLVEQIALPLGFSQDDGGGISK